MKQFAQLGRSLSKAELKRIKGGSYPVGDAHKCETDKCSSNAECVEINEHFVCADHGDCSDHKKTCGL